MSFSLVAPVEPSLSCGERSALPMAQLRGKSDFCEQQDVGEGRQWGARLSPIVPSGVDANPAWPCWNLLTALVTGASPKLFRYAVAGMSDKMLQVFCRLGVSLCRYQARKRKGTLQTEFYMECQGLERPEVFYANILYPI